jgi:hypothetical protein
MANEQPSRKRQETQVNSPRAATPYIHPCIDALLDILAMQAAREYTEKKSDTPER